MFEIIRSRKCLFSVKVVLIVLEHHQLLLGVDDLDNFWSTNWDPFYYVYINEMRSLVWYGLLQDLWILHVHQLLEKVFILASRKHWGYSYMTQLWAFIQCISTLLKWGEFLIVVDLKEIMTSWLLLKSNCLHHQVRLNCWEDQVLSLMFKEQVDP